MLYTVVSWYHASGDYGQYCCDNCICLWALSIIQRKHAKQCHCMSEGSMLLSWNAKIRRQDYRCTCMCGDSRGCPTFGQWRQTGHQSNTQGACRAVNQWTTTGNMHNTTCNLDDNWSVKSWNGIGSHHRMATMCSTNLIPTMHTHVHKYALNVITHQLLDNKFPKTHALQNIGI